MKKLIIIFTLMFLSSSNAEIARDVVIEGNNRISDETIKVYGNIRLNTDINKQDINQILKDLYSTEFFENIEITLNNGVLKISVVENPIIHWQEVLNMLKFIALLKSFFEDIFVDIYFGFSTEKEQVILVAFFLFSSGNGR